MKNPDYGKLAIKLVEKVIKVIKKEVFNSSKDESSKEKRNGKTMESSGRCSNNHND